MKFLKSILPGFLMVLFLFSFHSFAQNSGTGSISGTIMSQADSLPIPHAKILAYKTQDIMMLKKYRAETDANGNYRVENLPQGQYRVYVRADSFVAKFYEDTRNPLLSTPITVGDGAAVIGIDFYLKLGGIISGVVVDSSGVGIPDAFVAATPYDIFSQPPWLDSLLIWGGDFTDENGFYRMSTLDSGEYRIIATVKTNSPPFLLTKYYDNKDNFFDADPLLIDNEQEISGVDFQFDYELPSGGITGTITDAAGSPLSGIYVFAWKHSDSDSFHWNFRGFHNFIISDDNGNYEIKNLQSGEYFVSATRMEMWNCQTIWYDGVAAMQDATPVPVTDTIITDIDFVFDQAADLGSITGKVVSDVDGAPVANVFVEAMWTGSFAGHGYMGFRPSMFAWTDANGDYTLDQLQAGKYIILVHQNGYTEFYDDTQDIGQATQVEVQAGTETSGIDFGVPAVPDTGSRVSGIVTNDSTGAPIEGAIVTLFPVMQAPYGGAFGGKFTLFDFYATVSDVNGQYMIAGIPEGEYIVVSWAQGFIVEFYDNKSTPWDADKIELDGTSEVSNINFALAPGWGFRFGPGGDMAIGMISGLVTDNEGRYVASAHVSIIDQNYQVRATEMTGADGSYTLSGIPAGEYYIKVDRMPYSTSYFGNTTELSSATPVTVGESGNFSVTNVDVQLVPMSATSVEEQNDVNNVPAKFELSQNYPNPFNPTTTIRYALPKASHVTLKIYNLRGELVNTLVNGYQTAQNHQAVWNGENEMGQKVAAGIYLYQLQAGNYKQTMRLILLK